MIYDYGKSASCRRYTHHSLAFASLPLSQKRKDSWSSDAVAIADRVGKKGNQMSFSKGDLIEFVEPGNQKWHKGFLRMSSTHPIDSKKPLYYPMSLVQPA